MRRRKNVLRDIERHMIAIGKRRDALRRILADLSVIADALDDGYADLEIAIQTLSFIHWDARGATGPKSRQRKNVLPPLADLLARAVAGDNASAGKLSDAWHEGDEDAALSLQRIAGNPAGEMLPPAGITAAR